ncbi:MAG: hypothetical protein P8O78_03250 [Flavobacteriaceae bacterium]|nr:hypothetical protein [Flavobacteriaceae bacterium]
MKKLILLYACLFGMNLQAQWTQEKGKGYYKIGVWWLEADEHYTNTGLVDPNATRGLFITNFFGRYGLNDKITLIGYIPHTRVYQNAQVFSSGREHIPGEQFSSLGDINLGVEYQVAKNKGWAHSISLSLGLPSGKNRGGSDGSYQTGDGEFNQLLRLHIGKSYQLGAQHFYAKASVGVNQRSNGFSDEFHANIETGTKVFKEKFLLLLRSNTIQSFHNGSLDASNSNGSIFANNVEVVNLGGELIYQLSPKLSWGLSGSYPLSGRVLYRAPAFSTGISYQP